MAGIDYLTLDVFTESALSGNQLAVVPDASGLSAERMQQIANEFSLSETTFVLPPDDGVSACRVRIFTPLLELPMAGHPTIGTTYALAHLGRLRPGQESIGLQLGIGPTPVALVWQDQRLSSAWMTQPGVELSDCPGRLDGLAEALRLTAADLEVPALPVQVASAGVPFLYVPVKSRAAVDAAELNRQKLVAWCGHAGLPELPVYLFSLEVGEDDALCYSRMFAPVLGVEEDPATGGASGPLLAYLVHYGVAPSSPDYVAVNIQGVRMGRPSRILMRMGGADTDPGAVVVGGQAVVVGEGRLYL
jgi:trans-2,3-dihydro-3-hydroxyanthranilate isomerase